MIFRGILAGIFVFLASLLNASQLCEQILKEDFRETSNIKLVHHDGGIVLHPNKTLIDKIRYGSAANEIDLRSGDRIVGINNIILSNTPKADYEKLISILDTPGKKKISLNIERQDGSKDQLLLEKDSYFGHPRVETAIKLNDIEITHQSSKTRLDLDVHLKWDNDKIIHRLEKILGIEENEIINCQFRKSQELENILKKIWYPWFDTTLTGASIENIKFENLLITNDDTKPFHFILVQQVDYISKNKSDFQKFPFDNISTKADFIFQDSDLGISALYEPDYVTKKGNEILYDWQITKHDINCCFPKKRGQQGTLEKITYSFELDRKYFYYILKIVIPVVFLVWLSFSVFFIRTRELESKLAISLSILLTIVVYFFVFADDLPKINKTTVLDSWILLSYLFVGLTALATVFNFWLYQNGKIMTESSNALDKKLRWIMPISYHLLMLVTFWGFMSGWSILT